MKKHLKNKVLLTALCTSGILVAGETFTSCSHANKSEEAEPNVAYLFTYFTGNAPQEEQICYAVSTDGINYSPLNDGKPILSSDTISVKGGVRDPHILRGDEGYFYMVATDMRSSEGWASNRGMVLMRSRDMVNWEHHTVHFPERFKDSRFERVLRVWAPQTIFDTRANKYMIYFSILTSDEGDYDKVYYAYANADFSDLEDEPVLLFDRGRSSIDTDIVMDEKGVYHIFFKTEGDQRKGILQYTCSQEDLTNDAKWNKCEDNAFIQPTNQDVEGSGVFRRIDGDWVLMYDCYRSGYYEFCESSDLKHFKAIQQTKTEGLFTPRHGTVIAIKQSELDRLQSAFPNTVE